MSVTINPPKTPVTKGSKGVAAATLPNPCKMPGPPPPFVPTPLPNVGNSGDSPKGYTKSVKVQGQSVAIKGASFGSEGDMASKATGGGLVSACTHGRTTFVGPGSKDVKFEGKSVQLLGDPMFNNCGAGGRTPNSATMVGVLQESGLMVLAGDEVCPLCGKKHEDAGKLEETKATKGDADVLGAAVERAVAKAKAERDRRVAPEQARLEAKAQQDYEARRSKLEANMKAARAHGRMDAAAKIEAQLARLRPKPVNVSLYDVTLAAMLGVVRCEDGSSLRRHFLGTVFGDCRRAAGWLACASWSVLTCGWLGAEVHRSLCKSCEVRRQGRAYQSMEPSRTRKPTVHERYHSRTVLPARLLRSPTGPRVGARAWRATSGIDGAMVQSGFSRRHGRGNGTGQ